jgi:hypothetical protein
MLSQQTLQGNGADHAFLAIVHVIAALIVIGYAQNYYFHLREYQDHNIALRPFTKSS